MLILTIDPKVFIYQIGKRPVNLIELFFFTIILQL